MCPHLNHEILYYARGVMLRRCLDCYHIELRSDWIWTDIPAIEAALATIMEYVPKCQ